MKKVLAFVCMLLLALSLAGCVQRQPSEPPAAVQRTARAAPQPMKETPQPEAKEFSVDDVKMTDTPNSSCFSEIGYDESWEILVVVFRDNGAKYIYYDFTPDDWQSFKSADSLGRYFNANIKGSFEYERVE